MTEAKPKRRWFRFSLRTLSALVIATGLASFWAVEKLNWIRQRHRFLDLHYGSPLSDPMLVNTRMPWSLRLFGERCVDYLSGVPDIYMNEAKLLFPESQITGPLPIEPIELN